MGSVQCWPLISEIEMEGRCCSCLWSASCLVSRVIWVDSGYNGAPFEQWVRRTSWSAPGGCQSSVDWPARRLGERRSSHRLGQDHGAPCHGMRYYPKWDQHWREMRKVM